jgi:hypothetical protein
VSQLWVHECEREGRRVQVRTSVLAALLRCSGHWLEIGGYRARQAL